MYKNAIQLHLMLQPSAQFSSLIPRSSIQGSRAFSVLPLKAQMTIKPVLFKSLAQVSPLLDFS